MTSCTIPEAVERLVNNDLTLETIDLRHEQYSTTELVELIDGLLFHSNVVAHVYLGGNQLVDETGVKLSQYIATSSTIKSLDLRYNWFTSTTYLGIATALRVNSSLRVLFMYGNLSVKNNIDDPAFVEALRLNPNRPTGSLWYLYSVQNEFDRMKEMAEEIGHPSLQALLATTI